MKDLCHIHLGSGFRTSKFEVILDKSGYGQIKVPSDAQSSFVANKVTTLTCDENGPVKVLVKDVLVNENKFLARIVRSSAR